MSSNTAAASHHQPSPKSSTEPPPPSDVDEQSGSSLQHVAAAAKERGPIIAVDLDDVLSQTNAHVAAWHNKNYGSNMTLDDFHYYHYWKNPYWGTPALTNQKVKSFYSTNEISNALPVPGAMEGTKKLREMGYRLVVVTARARNQLENSWEWLGKWFPGIFERVICIGQFEEAVEDEGKEIITKLTKAEVCRTLPALLLIDDSLDNALAVSAPSSSTNDQPIPVLLFGTYEWNKRRSLVESEKDKMGYEQRKKVEGGRDWWVDEDWKGDLTQGGEGIWRVKVWEEAVRWVEENRGVRM